MCTRMCTAEAFHNVEGGVQNPLNRSVDSCKVKIDSAEEAVRHSPALLKTPQYGTQVILANDNIIKDAVIVLQNNITICINRQDFVKISSYFRAIFSGNMLESKSGVVNLSRMKPRSVLQCCSIARCFITDTALNGYAKKALLSVDIETAFEILDVASYLLIEPILSELTKLIVAKINAASLVLAYHKAVNRHVPLAQLLWKILVRQFDKVLSNKTFLVLSESEIVRLFHSRHLNIGRAQEIAMIRDWISFNEVDLKKASAALVKISAGNGESGSLGDCWTRLPNSVLLASGGWCPFGPTTAFETYDSMEQCWVRSSVTFMEHTRAYHAVVNMDNQLYIIGGFNGQDYYRTMRKFNLDTVLLTEMASMYEQRCYISAAAYNAENIIALGGFNGRSRLRTAEMYRIPDNQWKRIAQMAWRRSDGHCLVIDGVAYAIGGFDGANCHSTVECYDPQKDAWIQLQKEMNVARSGVSAVELYGAVFVCGGFNGRSRLQSCELLDPREGNWHQFRPMSHARSNFGMETLYDRIIVAGGYGGIMGTLSAVEQYDIRANAWFEMAPLGLRRSALYLTRVDDHDSVELLLRPDATESN